MMRFKKWLIVFALYLITFVVSAENQEESPELAETDVPSTASVVLEKAEPGYAEAQYNLGVMFYTGEGVIKNDVEAAECFRKAAERGHVYAQYNLGAMYHNGIGVTQNDIEAAKWFRKAAEQGNADAQNDLGVMYYLGKGVTQNDIEAAKWFRKAAEQEHAAAYGGLGWLLITQGKFDEAQTLTEKAHQKQPQMFAWSMNLGHIYLLKGDRQTARSYYQEALPLIPDDASFEQGPIADFELFIEKGWQVKACQSELDWIRSAFEQLKLAKSQDDQQLLAEEAQLDQDTFVVSAENQEESPELAETDDELVFSPFQSFQATVKQAERGEAEAQNELGMKYDFGIEVTENDISAAKWYRKAAEQGHAEAQLKLGMMYVYGTGVTQNNIEATKWIRKAAEQEHVDAYGHLVQILITQGKFDEAQSVTEKAHQKQPQVFAWAISLGHIFLLKGDHQTAKKYYQEALPLIPEEASFEQEFASFEQEFADLELFTEKELSELDSIPSAVEPFKLDNEYEFVFFSSQTVSFQAIVEKAEQGDANAQFNLGVMYGFGIGVTQNDISAAKWFRKAAKQEHAGAYGGLGWILITQGKFDEAQSVTEKALQKQPQVLAWTINLGHIFLLKGECQTARKYYRKALLDYQEPLFLMPDDVSFEQGAIADFEGFIEKGWQVKACRSELDWIRSAFKQIKLAKTYDNQFAQSYQQGRFEEAVLLAEKVFHLRKEFLGEKHPETLTSLKIIAVIYKDLGRFSDALPWAEKAYRLYKELLGEKHPDTLTSQNYFASLYQDLGRLSEALSLFEKAYHLRKEVLGEKHPLTLISLNSLAVIYQVLGRLSEALPLLEKGYRLRKYVSGEKHPQTLKSMNNLARIYQDLGRLYEALSLFESGYNLSKEVLGEKHPETLTSLNNLAMIYLSLGRLSEALSLYEKGYRLYKEVLGEKHPETLISMTNLARIYQDLGRLSEALSLYEKGYRLRKDVLGEKHPDILGSLINLGAIYQDLGRSSDALHLSEKAYHLSSEILGEKHPSTLTSLHNLAVIYQNLDRLSEALPLIEKNYRLRKEMLGEKHPDTLLNLTIWAAVMYLDSGRSSEALPLLEKGYRLQSEVLGEKHPDTLNSMTNLAAIYKELGRLSEALPLLEKAYRLSSEVLGEKHPDSLDNLHHLANIYEKQGKINKAIEHLEKFVTGVETLRSGDLSAENRQTLFKKRVPDYFLLGRLYIDQSRPFEAWSLAEMSKARTLLESLAAKLAAQQSGLTTAEQQQLQDYEARLAFLNNSIGKTLKDNRLEEKLVLETEKNQLVIQLAQFDRELRAKYPKYAQLSEVQIIGAKEGAKYLPADAVLISYLVNKNEVLAFTLQSDGTLTAHNLGEIPNIEKDLETYRRLLSLGIQVQEESAPSSHENRPFRLKKPPTTQSLSRQLGKQLLEPLSDIIKDKPHWIISPNGSLALIPFETLRLEGENQPVIAQHQITYVQSLSVLKLLQERDKVYNSLENRGTLLAMGAPLYRKNADVAKNRGNPSTTDYKIARQMIMRGGDYARALRQLGRGGNYWKNLPGALAELSKLEELFSQTKPRIYKQADATEAKLQSLNKKGVLAQYRYLVFSAHGDINLKVPALSSIVLGQVNNPPEIDGYVTAGEWPGYDLKSDLMVLSACETGVGEVVGGEGVMGLPYAFYVAGNKNTILTLWKISDEITTEFITSFFAKLKAGVGQIEALTATKREFLKKGGFYSNPKFWAAFVLYGV